MENVEIISSANALRTTKHTVFIHELLRKPELKCIQEVAVPKVAKILHI